MFTEIFINIFFINNKISLIKIEKLNGIIKNLSYNLIGYEGATKLCEGLRKLDNLISLNLDF